MSGYVGEWDRWNAGWIRKRRVWRKQGREIGTEERKCKRKRERTR